MRDATCGAFSNDDKSLIFQSTHPMRDATNMRHLIKMNFLQFQSTHPMRDATHMFRQLNSGSKNFNPRIPCGMRLMSTSKTRNISWFQSTHPMRDATSGTRSKLQGQWISIHASHAGCDGMAWKDISEKMDFNPRIPCGMRHNFLHGSSSYKLFQSTHPMRDAT